MLKKYISVIFIVLHIAAVCGVDYARAQSAFREDVQSAFIHKFIKFIEWPDTALASDSNVIVVGIIGNGTMVKALTKIGDKEVRGLKIVVRKVNRLREIETCNVLFISPSEEKRYEKILDQVKGSNILTVGQTKGFAQKGVIINFVVVNNKIRFEINLNAGTEAGLRISSKLLNLATDVIR